MHQHLCCCKWQIKNLPDILLLTYPLVTFGKSLPFVIEASYWILHCVYLTDCFLAVKFCLIASMWVCRVCITIWESLTKHIPCEYSGGGLTPPMKECWHEFIPDFCTSPSVVFPLLSLHGSSFTIWAVPKALGIWLAFSNWDHLSSHPEWSANSADQHLCSVASE